MEYSTWGQRELVEELERRDAEGAKWRFLDEDLAKVVYHYYDDEMDNSQRSPIEHDHIFNSLSYLDRYLEEKGFCPIHNAPDGKPFSAYRPAIAEPRYRIFDIENDCFLDEKTYTKEEAREQLVTLFWYDTDPDIDGDIEDITIETWCENAHYKLIPVTN